MKFLPIMTLTRSPREGCTGCKCSAAMLTVRSSSGKNTEHIPGVTPRMIPTWPQRPVSSCVSRIVTSMSGEYQSYSEKEFKILMTKQNKVGLRIDQSYLAKPLVSEGCKENLHDFLESLENNPTDLVLHILEMESVGNSVLGKALVHKSSGLA